MIKRNDLIRAFNDDLAYFDGFFNFSQPAWTMLRGELYNPETHDLVPKPSYYKQQLDTREKQLSELKDRRESYLKVTKEQEESLVEQIKDLKAKISP